jgi:hypothetical protein
MNMWNKYAAAHPGVPTLDAMTQAEARDMTENGHWEQYINWLYSYEKEKVTDTKGANLHFTTAITYHSQAMNYVNQR